MDEIVSVIQINVIDISQAWEMRVNLPHTNGLPPSEARFLLDDQRGLELLVEGMFNRLCAGLNDNDDADAIVRKRHEIKLAIENAAMLMLIAASHKKGES